MRPEKPRSIEHDVLPARQLQAGFEMDLELNMEGSDLACSRLYPSKSGRIKQQFWDSFDKGG